MPFQYTNYKTYLPIVVGVCECGPTPSYLTRKIHKKGSFPIQVIAIIISVIRITIEQ